MAAKEQVPGVTQHGAAVSPSDGIVGIFPLADSHEVVAGL